MSSSTFCNFYKIWKTDRREAIQIKIKRSLMLNLKIICIRGKRASPSVFIAPKSRCGGRRSHSSKSPWRLGDSATFRTSRT